MLASPDHLNVLFLAIYEALKFYLESGRKLKPDLKPIIDVHIYKAMARKLQQTHAA